MSEKSSPSKVVQIWPSQIAYQDALQHPSLAFTDRQLRTCELLDFTPYGLPSPISGQFANVYRMRSPDGRIWGVKLFLRHLSNRNTHYKALQNHFGRLTTPPTWLVPFMYHEQGIRVGDSLYPVLQMPWLQETTPINVYIDEIVNDPMAIRRLRDAWRKLISEMEREQFAHGDLQHGNIMVRHGQDGKPPTFQLLDYDGSFVPALAGRVGTESGHPAYQHPWRQPGDYGPRIDRFAAVAVYTALLIVGRAPDLWYRFDNGDNILFRREDFTETQAKGRAIYELSTHRDAFVRRAIDALRSVCEAPVTLIPNIERYAMMAEMI